MGKVILVRSNQEVDVTFACQSKSEYAECSMSFLSRSYVLGTRRRCRSATHDDHRHGRDCVKPTNEIREVSDGKGGKRLQARGSHVKIELETWTERFVILGDLKGFTCQTPTRSQKERPQVDLDRSCK